ncbi:MAG TPA: alpha-2-macroglobulin, partial [Thermoanaerobaculia bacterium]
MIRKVGLLLVLAMLLLSVAAAFPPQGSEYAAIKAEAEKDYFEKSFSRAHEAYERAAKLKTDATERRWIEFRLADTQWRADSASPNPDRTKVNEARIALEKMTADDKPRDLVWVEGKESLGDYFATHTQQRNLSAAQSYYLAALDFWAGSSDIAIARERYLRLVFKLAPAEQLYNVPRNVLVNAMQIAETVEDRAHVRFLLALQLASGGSASSIERALELYNEIVGYGNKTSYYDVSLYRSAELLARDDEQGDYAE